MKKFRFRLQALLRLRERTRDERRSELAQAQQAQQIVRRRSSQILDEIEGLRRHIASDSAPGEVNVDRLLDSHRYEAILRAEQLQLAKQDEQLGEEIERRRQALVESDQEVRVLENLRERQQAEHDRELATRETKAMDDIAAQRVGQTRRQ